MGYKLTVFLFLVMIFECNGHLSILDNILSTAQEQIKSGVESVTGVVIGDLFGLNRQNSQQYGPQKGSEETIIVVVEDDHGYVNTNNYVPNQHVLPPPSHHHHHGHPPLNYDSAPRPRPPSHHQNPPFGHDSASRPNLPPRHYDQRPQGSRRPGYNSENHDIYHQTEYENNQNWGNQANSNNVYENNQNGRPYNNGNSNNNESLSNSKGTEGHQEENNNPKNLYDNANTNPFYDKPTTEYIKPPATSSPLPKDDETNLSKATEKTSNDIPLFVPLSPDEYVYGGDRIKISEPKRETGKTIKEKSDDNDFDIDIRIKDK